MHKILNKRALAAYLVLAGFGFSALFGNFSYVVHATDAPNQTDQTIGTELNDAVKNKIQRGGSFLRNIQSQIGNSESELELLKSNKSKLKSKIEDSKVNVKNLQSQLNNLANLIQSHQEKIRAVEILVAKYENQVAVFQQDVKDTETYLNAYVQVLDDAMSTYYLHSNAFFDSANDDPKLLAFLAYSDTTGEVLREHEYLLTMQNTTQDFANKIVVIQADLDKKKRALQEKLQTITELKNLLDEQKRGVVAAEESQKRLLAETQGKQLIYETLLEMSEKEEIQVSVQIERLKENFDFFQGKLDELKNDPSVQGLDFDNLSLADPSEVTSSEATSLRGNATLAWPVSPALGISAFFHDESYKNTMGVEHQAVDIRIGQGSQVRSAGDGVVTKAVDNGMAYSYIIVAHPGNYLTLYGHISSILVKEGEVVRQGGVIGLSGGMPGTKGAGWLTTGAHLHFEVFKDWKHIDPLNVLPLELVPVNSLPDKYLKKLMGENTDNRVQRPNGN